MPRFSCSMIFLMAGAFGLLAGWAAPARAEDFRIDNATYAGGLQVPLSQSTTIFHNGAVYDFMQQPAETVVFMKNPTRFVLLSSTHRIRAELPADKVTAFVDGVQPMAFVPRSWMSMICFCELPPDIGITIAPTRSPP